MAVFPVILDSCVLYPMYLRDTLLCAAEAGLYRVHWSQEILDGALRNLVVNQVITKEQGNRLERQMNLAFPEAMLEVTERLIPCMDNHEGDRHVLAAALIAKAHVIVTDNLKHFPSISLSQFRIEAQGADSFLTHLYDLFPELMANVIQTQASVLRNPPMSVSELLNLLGKSVPTFVSRF
ncbi:PIN domain-containing protein [Pseudanabaena sp. PCC 6802]|uniref:PIN domain-containing protein n=1 Tax=Pseudanabaena sp. PCC 6802 TaxID=118173 RepID=UPI0008FBFC19|nr:PIN domain-containing protein [Pseudanabaena sp. PCC 6802]